MRLYGRSWYAMLITCLALVTAGCAAGCTAGGDRGPGAPEPDARDVSATVATGATSPEPGVVRLAVNARPGAQANAAVLAHLLKIELGYDVELKNLDEEASWRGLEAGDVDVIVEHWGDPAVEREYVERKRVAVEAGPTGNQGRTGWYVPAWMAEQYPDIVDGANLNRYADLFRTSRSGGRGQLLGGDAPAATDQALVANLNLRFQVVPSKSEADRVRAAQMATARRTALLFHFREPHWLFALERHVRVRLPAYQVGCDADPARLACDYPDRPLHKFASRRFADGGGAAYRLIRDFHWSNEQQNLVASYIAVEGLPLDQAAARWVAANESVWRAWLPPR